MKRLVAIAALLTLFSCAKRQVGIEVERLSKSPGGKTLAVYEDASFGEAQQAQVGPRVVERAMRSSSFFSPDDIRAFAPKIADKLAQVVGTQRLIITGRESNNPPSYHVLASGRDLVIILYYGSNEMSRHASVIPAATTTVVRRPRRRRLRRPPPKASNPPPKLVERQKPKVADPPPKIADPPPKRVRKRRKRRPKKEPAKRLSTEEVRDRLLKLKRLHDKGLISDADYDRKRKQLLKQL